MISKVTSLTAFIDLGFHPKVKNVVFHLDLLEPAWSLLYAVNKWPILLQCVLSLPSIALVSSQIKNVFESLALERYFLTAVLLLLLLLLLLVKLNGQSNDQGNSQGQDHEQEKDNLLLFVHDRRSIELLSSFVFIICTVSIMRIACTREDW